MNEHGPFPWVAPGAVFHPEGAMYQHASGVWYVRDQGRWRVATPEEVANHTTSEEESE